MPLQPGITIAGRIRVDGSGARPPFDLSAVKITAEPVQRAGDVSLATASVAADADGRFVIRGVTPGRYRLVATLPVTARASGWVQRSGTIGGAETLDVAAAIAGESIANAEIGITDRAAQVSGAVRGTAANPPSDFTVVLFPADPALRVARTRRIQAVRAGVDGAYIFDVVAPGEYLLASVDDVEPGEWFDPAFLARLAPGAERIIVREK
jgi:hypothetical protein